MKGSSACWGLSNVLDFRKQVFFCSVGEGAELRQYASGVTVNSFQPG